jgi:hypothetical protein
LIVSSCVFATLILIRPILSSLDCCICELIGPYNSTWRPQDIFPHLNTLKRLRPVQRLPLGPLISLRECHLLWNEEAIYLHLYICRPVLCITSRLSDWFAFDTWWIRLPLTFSDCWHNLNYTAHFLKKRLGQYYVCWIPYSRRAVPTANAHSPPLHFHTIGRNIWETDSQSGPSLDNHGHSVTARNDQIQSTIKSTSA